VVSVRKTQVVLLQVCVSACWIPPAALKRYRFGSACAGL